MFCENCGTRNNENAKYCIKCGYDLNNQKGIVPAVNSQSYVQSSNNTSDGRGTASLVLGIVSFILPCIGFLTAIIGLCLGGTSKTKNGARTAGIVLNTIVVIIYAVFVIIPIFFGAAWPGIQKQINDEWSNISSNEPYSGIIINSI